MKIVVRKNNSSLLRNIYCMIVLFLPVNLIASTSFYSVTTPATIWYKYRSFDFSFLVIPLVIYAFVKKRKSYAISFDRIIWGIGIKDCIFYAVGLNNSVISFDFSLYIILIISWALTVLVLYGEYEEGKIPGEKFLDWYFLLAFFSMLLRMVLRMTTDGRYGAIGLSVGGTGFFAAVYIIYSLYVHEYKNTTPLILTLAILTLILSGQRTNLFLCILFCIPYAVGNMLLRKNNIGKQRKTVFLWGILLVGLIVICILIFLDELGIQIQGMTFITRTLDAVSRFVNRDLGGEMSVEGRFLSLEAGNTILVDNVFGITNVFYDLQYRMNKLNYPTYPHSGVLDCALLWSTPITLFCEIWIIRLLVKLRKKKNGMFWVILYIQILMIIWGSPFLDYPILFIILLLLSIAKELLIHGDNKKRLESIDYEYSV